MKLTINCAYCDAPHSFTQRNFKSAQRSLKMFSFRCNACGSTTGVELSTKRERQGAGYKAIVAKREAEHRRKVDAAKKRNAAIETKLLAQPGCMCADRQQNEFARRDAAARREQYGHAFASASETYGIPNVPHHNRHCPCYGSADESRIRNMPPGEVVPSEGAA